MTLSSSARRAAAVALLTAVPPAVRRGRDLLADLDRRCRPPRPREVLRLLADRGRAGLLGLGEAGRLREKDLDLDLPRFAEGERLNRTGEPEDACLFFPCFFRRAAAAPEEPLRLLFLRPLPDAERFRERDRFLGERERFFGELDLLFFFFFGERDRFFGERERLACRSALPTFFPFALAAGGLRDRLREAAGFAAGSAAAAGAAACFDDFLFFCLPTSAAPLGASAAPRAAEHERLRDAAALTFGAAFPAGSAASRSFPFSSVAPLSSSFLPLVFFFSSPFPSAFSATAPLTLDSGRSLPPSLAFCPVFFFSPPLALPDFSALDLLRAVAGDGEDAAAEEALLGARFFLLFRDGLRAMAAALPPPRLRPSAHTPPAACLTRAATTCGCRAPLPPPPAAGSRRLLTAADARR